MQYWLMKSEPDNFSITDLKKNPGQTEPWDGVRNYQARNFMRDKMRIGDKIFFYHSNCKEPGIVGEMKVASKPYPDPTAFDPKSKYYDSKSSTDNPRWFLVDCKFICEYPKVISLSYLKTIKSLADFQLLKKGNRLSILPVSQQYWDIIKALPNE